VIQFDEATHTYTVEGVKYPSVTEILKEMGLIDTSWFTPEGCVRGQYVHQIIEWSINEELDTYSVDPLLTGYLEAWERFTADTGWWPILTEHRMASEVYHFAGTADQIGLFSNNQRAIIDIKSGAVSPCTPLQLSGYEILYGQPCKRFALQLHDNGTYKLTEYKDRGDRSTFLAAVALWHWKANNLGRG
jgi:hypothetical protein